MTMEKFGQYILLEKIGSGGMAELFKAKKIGIEGFERVLAIKRILPHLSSDEEFITMFIDEAKLIARLSHKNITHIYDFGRIEQNYYIAMEYIRGKDLRSALRRCHETNLKFPLPLAIFIAKEIASGLSYAHRQKDSMGQGLNIIHRDISPQNILISYDGDVKVVDFGIAKASSHSRTTTGVLKGKLSYMSPEQAWGRPIDHRSDIFSLGIVLYEMLTGERLFKGDAEINTLEKVRAARIDPLPSSFNIELSAGLEQKILKALAKETSERYQDASEMEADLGEALFELLRTDPSISLKDFMHDLFRAEIEAEHKSEMDEETIRIQMEAAAPAADRKKEEAVEVKKGSPFVIPAFLAAAVLLILVFTFWNRNAPHPVSPKDEAAVPLSSRPESSGAANKDDRTGTVSSGQVAGKEKAKPSKPGKDGQSAGDSRKSEKATQAPAEEGEGGLSINAVPWANVFITGKPYGTTPKTIEGLKAGTYQVKLENPNFPAWETKVTISKGQVANISHRFGGFGRLIVNASPWGNVYVDGALKGQTPLTIEKIPAGKHVIKIGREGFADVDRTYEISEGTTEQMSVTLKKDGG